MVLSMNFGLFRINKILKILKMNLSKFHFFMLQMVIIARQQNLQELDKKKRKNTSHTGEEEYNFFLAVLFPEDQLKIFDCEL